MTLVLRHTVVFIAPLMSPDLRSKPTWGGGGEVTAILNSDALISDCPNDVS